MTPVDETDCSGLGNNGLSANGPGLAGNLCQVDCANRGACSVSCVCRAWFICVCHYVPFGVVVIAVAGC